MSRVRFIIAVTGCCCFVLGFSSAYYLFGYGRAPAIQNEPRPHAHADAIKMGAGDSAPAAESARLAPKNEEKFLAEGPRKPEVSEKLVERLFSSRPAEDILPNNAVSDELADCLGMTIQERNKVDEALKAALDCLKEEQRKHAKVAQTDDDSMIFSVEKFSLSGRSIREIMRNKVNESLGLDRSVLFMRLTKSAIDDAYLNFGQTDVRIELHGLSKETDYEVVVQSGTTWRRFETTGVPSLLQGIIEW
jgi:hypothetical protein